MKTASPKWRRNPDRSARRPRAARPLNRSGVETCFTCGASAPAPGSTCDNALRIVTRLQNFVDLGVELATRHDFVAAGGRSLGQFCLMNVRAEGDDRLRWARQRTQPANRVRNVDARRGEIQQDQ